MSALRRFACFTMEDGVYESASGDHVAYADYKQLSDSLVRACNSRDDLLGVLHEIATRLDSAAAETDCFNVCEARDLARGALKAEA